jgi:hypothetical protein
VACPPRAFHVAVSFVVLLLHFALADYDPGQAPSNVLQMSQLELELAATVEQGPVAASFQVKGPAAAKREASFLVHSF